ETVMVQESSTARTALIPFGHEGLTWTRSGGGSLGWGVGAAIGAKIAVGHERPVVLHLGDGALTYSASGFWTMARYKTPILTIVSNNETYQIVRHNWANQMPDSKMVRDGKYPGLFLGDPALYRAPRLQDRHASVARVRARLARRPPAPAECAGRRRGRRAGDARRPPSRAGRLEPDPDRGRGPRGDGDRTQASWRPISQRGRRRQRRQADPRRG